MEFNYYVWKYSEGLFCGYNFYFVCATVNEKDAILICESLRETGIDCIYTEVGHFPHFLFPFDSDGGYKRIDEDKSC